MKLVFGQDDLVAGWVATNLGLTFVPPYTAIGGTKDGESLCAGAVFNNYNGSNIEISIFGAPSLGAIRAAYHYAFEQLKVNRLAAVTRRSNKKMRRHLPRLGFKFEGIGERYFGPTRADDAIRFVLFPEDARKWING